jgi:hypothetical protein
MHDPEPTPPASTNDAADETLAADTVGPSAGAPPSAADGAIEPVDPGQGGSRQLLLYTLSVPERALRSGAGLVGGALRESTALLVPRAFQNSKTYSVMVRQMLDFLVEDVGGVTRPVTNEQTAKVENFVARKAVGNFIEMAGLATLHLSPLTLLAVVSDVAYGSQTYLKELSCELKQQGVIDENSTIDHADDLLAAIARTSGTMAGAFDTPPLSVDGLRQTIDETRQAVATIDPVKVIPAQELDRMWREMRELADREGVGLLDLSSAVTLTALDKIGHAGRGALSTVTVAGKLFDRHVIDHYEEALGKIREQGFYATLSESSRPYIEAVWGNFSSTKATVTEDIVSGRLIGTVWNSARRWLGAGQ